MSTGAALCLLLAGALAVGWLLLLGWWLASVGAWWAVGAVAVVVIGAGALVVWADGAMRRGDRK